MIVMCVYDLFARTQHIYCLDEHEVQKKHIQSNLSNMVDFALSVTKEFGAKRLVLVGNRGYAENILLPQIDEKSNYAYSRNELEVVVAGEPR